MVKWTFFLLLLIYIITTSSCIDDGCSVSLTGSESAFLNDVIVATAEVVGCSGTLLVVWDASYADGAEVGSELSDCLTDASLDGLFELEIPANTVQHMSDVTISVEVSNPVSWEGEVISRSHTVAIDACVEEVSIVLSSTALYESQEMFAVMQASGCTSDLSGFDFSWEILTTSANFSTSLNRQMLWLPEYTLEVGDHIIEATTCLHSTDDCASEAVVFTVKADPPTAVLRGGSGTHSSDWALTLDASESYSADGSDLLFSWSCVALQGTCPSDSLFTPDSVVYLNTSSLPYGTFEFFVLVEDDRGFTSETSRVIEVSPLSTPSLEIYLFPTGPFAPDDKLILRAAASTDVGGLELLWEQLIIDEDLLYGSVEISTDVLDLEAEGVLLTSVASSSFAIAANTLQPGETYTFRCTAVDSAGSTWKAVTVKTAESPTAGSVTVSPTTGTALETEFRLTASSWSDPYESGLQYRFFVEAQDGETVILSQWSGLSSVEVTLPAGLYCSSPSATPSPSTTLPNMTTTATPVTTNVYLVPMVSVRSRYGAVATVSIGTVEVHCPEFTDLVAYTYYRLEESWATVEVEGILDTVYNTVHQVAKFLDDAGDSSYDAATVRALLLADLQEAVSIEREAAGTVRDVFWQAAMLSAIAVDLGGISEDDVDVMFGLVETYAGDAVASLDGLSDVTAARLFSVLLMCKGRYNTMAVYASATGEELVNIALQTAAGLVVSDVSGEGVRCAEALVLTDGIATAAAKVSAEILTGTSDVSLMCAEDVGLQVLATVPTSVLDELAWTEEFLLIATELTESPFPAAVEASVEIVSGVVQVDLLEIVQTAGSSYAMDSVGLISTLSDPIRLDFSDLDPTLLESIDSGEDALRCVGWGADSLWAQAEGCTCLPSPRPPESAGVSFVWRSGFSYWQNSRLFAAWDIDAEGCATEFVEDVEGRLLLNIVSVGDEECTILNEASGCSWMAESQAFVGDTCVPVETMECRCNSFGTFAVAAVSHTTFEFPASSSPNSVKDEVEFMLVWFYVMNAVFVVLLSAAYLHTVLQRRDFLEKVGMNDKDASVSSLTMVFGGSRAAEPATNGTSGPNASAMTNPATTTPAEANKDGSARATLLYKEEKIPHNASPPMGTPPPPPASFLTAATALGVHGPEGAGGGSPLAQSPAARTSGRALGRPDHDALVVTAKTSAENGGAAAENGSQEDLPHTVNEPSALGGKTPPKTLPPITGASTKALSPIRSIASTSMLLPLGDARREGELLKQNQLGVRALPQLQSPQASSPNYDHLLSQHSSHKIKLAPISRPQDSNAAEGKVMMKDSDFADDSSPKKEKRGSRLRLGGGSASSLGSVRGLMGRPQAEGTLKPTPGAGAVGLRTGRVRLSKCDIEVFRYLGVSPRRFVRMIPFLQERPEDWWRIIAMSRRQSRDVHCDTERSPSPSPSPTPTTTPPGRKPNARNAILKPGSSTDVRTNRGSHFYATAVLLATLDISRALDAATVDNLVWRTGSFFNSKAPDSSPGNDGETMDFRLLVEKLKVALVHMNSPGWQVRAPLWRLVLLQAADGFWRLSADVFIGLNIPKACVRELEDDHPSAFEIHLLQLLPSGDDAEDSEVALLSRCAPAYLVDDNQAKQPLSRDLLSKVWATALVASRLRGRQQWLVQIKGSAVSTVQHAELWLSRTLGSDLTSRVLVDAAAVVKSWRLRDVPPSVSASRMIVFAKAVSYLALHDLRRTTRTPRLMFSPTLAASRMAILWCNALAGILSVLLLYSDGMSNCCDQVKDDLCEDDDPLTPCCDEVYCDVSSVRTCGELLSTYGNHLDCTSFPDVFSYPLSSPATAVVALVLPFVLDCVLVYYFHQATLSHIPDRWYVPSSIGRTVGRLWCGGRVGGVSSRYQVNPSSAEAIDPREPSHVINNRHTATGPASRLSLSQNLPFAIVGYLIFVILAMMVYKTIDWSYDLEFQLPGDPKGDLMLVLGVGVSGGLATPVVRHLLVNLACASRDLVVWAAGHGSSYCLDVYGL
eukprot:Rmarinus@m.22430